MQHILRMLNLASHLKPSITAGVLCYPWKMCCLQFPLKRSYTYSLMLLIVLWSAFPEDTTCSMWFPVLALSSPPAPDTAPHCFCWVLPKATWPSYLPVSAGQEQAQCWHQCWKEVKNSLWLMSTPYEVLVLWQRVRAAAWDRRGWVSALEMGERCFFTPAQVPYKDNISHDFLGISILYLPFLQPP